MGVKNHSIRVHEAPDWTNRTYRMADDPLWTKALQPEAFDHLYFYHCDQIGTPLEMTDEQGNTVWRAEYKAWGEAMLVTEKVRNPLRFQGQYFDHETGLHYNRFRYYDPQIGRYISKDPIGLAGGMNPYAYAPNPTLWVDPLGLVVEIVASKPEDRKIIQEAYNLMKSTPRGKQIAQQLENRKDTVKIMPSTDGNFYCKPRNNFSACEGEENTVFLDIRDCGIFVKTEDGYRPMSKAVALAHELGHALGKRYQEVENEQKNIDDNENPVRKALGEPTRTSYEVSSKRCGRMKKN